MTVRVGANLYWRPHWNDYDDDDDDDVVYLSREYLSWAEYSRLELTQATGMVEHPDRRVFGASVGIEPRVVSFESVGRDSVKALLEVMGQFLALPNF